MFDAIGAHIYAGGFTVGVSRHFNVMAHLEHSGYGAEVVKLNFPNLPIYPGGPESWPDRWSKKPRFIYANPPCAIWSTASSGRAVEWREDPRLQYHHDIFHYALDNAAVDVLAMESVPPSFTKGRDHVNDLVSKAAERGYSSTIVAHDAQYLKVAQRRSRMFYVFHKVEIEWEIPDFSQALTVRQILKQIGKRKTHGFNPTTGIPKNSIPLLAAAEAGEKLRVVYDRLNPIPKLGDRGQKIGGPSFLEQRVPWDKPSPVLIESKLYHPVENRFLNQEELAAICSFPPEFIWPKEKTGTVTGWMSRGVMPNVGDWLGRNVAKALNRGKRLNTTNAMLLDITNAPGRYNELSTQGEYEMPKKTQVAVTTGRPPDKTEGEGSGAYIRRLLTLGVTSNEVILEAVHRQFPGSKATASDVSYNKNKLKQGGAPTAKPAPVIVEAKKPPKYAPQTELPWEAPKKNGGVPEMSKNSIDFRELRRRVMTKVGDAAFQGMLNSVINVLEKL